MKGRLKLGVCIGGGLEYVSIVLHILFQLLRPPKGLIGF